MIHSLTSSYKNDFVRASSLNQQLINNGVTHHIFVENSDIDLFKLLEERGHTFIHVKPDGGEGGLGRSGTMARFPCYKKMQEIIVEGDTYAQLDSDVIFMDARIIPDLECSADEVKGFYHPSFPVHLERPASAKQTEIRFCHLSGMTICAGWRVFNNSIPKDEAAMLSIIDMMLDEGFTPSEDVMLSYLLQRGDDFKLTNLAEDFGRTFYPNGDIEIYML